MSGELGPGSYKDGTSFEYVREAHSYNITNNIIYQEMNKQFTCNQSPEKLKETITSIYTSHAHEAALYPSIVQQRDVAAVTVKKSPSPKKPRRSPAKTVVQSRPKLDTPPQVLSPPQDQKDPSATLSPDQPATQDMNHDGEKVPLQDQNESSHHDASGEGDHEEKKAEEENKEEMPDGAEEEHKDALKNRPFDDDEEPMHDEDNENADAGAGDNSSPPADDDDVDPDQVQPQAQKKEDEEEQEKKSDSDDMGADDDDEEDNVRANVMPTGPKA